jgi:hypothetical protein
MLSTENRRTTISLVVLTVLAAPAFILLAATRAEAQTKKPEANAYYNAERVVLGSSHRGSKVDVSGSGFFTDFTDNVRIEKAVPELQLSDTQSSGRLWRLMSGSSAAGSFNVYDHNAGAYRLTIDTSGNVGIGTTSPDSPLHVGNGPAMTAGWNRSVNLHATYPVAVFNSAATRWAGIGYDYTTAMRFWVNATSNDVPGTGLNAMTILNGGNVGIGTGNPYTRLHVSGGDISVDANQGIRKAGDNWIIGYSNSLPGIIIGSGTTSDQVAINSGGSERFRILTNGSIGIGTNAPGYKLEVNGEINATGLRINGTPISSGGSQWSGSGSIFYNGGNVGIGTTSPGNLLHVSTSLSADADLLKLEDTNLNSNLVGLMFKSVSGPTAALRAKYTNPASTTATELQFFTNPTGGNNNLTPRMVINGSGNIGIGTTGPANKLHLATTTDADGLVVSNSTTVNGTRAAIYLSTLNATPAMGNVSIEAMSVASAYPDMVFRTAGISAVNAIGTERMRITSNGNVGIGRNDVSYRLDVYGPSGDYPGRVASPDGFLLFGPANTGWSYFTTDRPRFYFNTAITVDTGEIGSYNEDLSLQTSGITRLTINNSTGNVGVGKAPDLSYKLDVNGEINATGLRINGTSISGSHWTGTGSISYNDGNVGIGTISPGTKLEVSGQGRFNPGASFSAIDTGWAAAFGYSAGNWGVRLGATGGQGVIQVAQNTTPYDLTVQPYGGNVGIGTTAPAEGYKLDVNGKTKVTGNLNIAAGNGEPGNIVAAGTIFAKYQDLAEWVESSEQLAAGTVVVLDSTKSNHIVSSSQSYDTRVAGVISAQPGIALGEKSDTKVLVATTGRVKVKVDASKGPIHIGDLLVTSDVPGVAMKSEPVELAGRKMHMPGTLIGKALEPLEKGSGEILVLLSLQ